MARVGSSGGGGASSLPNASAVYVYNEVTAVASGIETTIAMYTNNNSATCYLQAVEGAGTNKAEYRVYINSNVIDKQYSSFTQYNVNFNYLTSIATFPGIKLSANDVVYVKAIQNRNTTCNFNAVIQVTEIT